jgi:NAD(P)-dependent dehydrogenase (short-subunit alcohol dehydrogenase family)
LICGSGRSRDRNKPRCRPGRRNGAREAGATVYVTGGSVRGAPSGPGREGTLEETADAVEERGGSAVPVRCDHTSPGEVESLFERVRREQGRLDVLVNNAWGGYGQRTDEPEVPFFDAPFWE